MNAWIIMRHLKQRDEHDLWQVLFRDNVSPLTTALFWQLAQTSALIDNSPLKRLQ